MKVQQVFGPALVLNVSRLTYLDSSEHRRENVGEMVDGQLGMLLKFGVPAGPVVDASLDNYDSEMKMNQKMTIQGEKVSSGTAHLSPGAVLRAAGGAIGSLSMHLLRDSQGSIVSPQLILGRADMIGPEVAAAVGLQCNASESGTGVTSTQSARFALVQVHPSDPRNDNALASQSHRDIIPVPREQQAIRSVSRSHSNGPESAFNVSFAPSIGGCAVLAPAIEIATAGSDVGPVLV